MEKRELSKLERISAKIAGTVIGGEYLLAYNNFNGLHASGLCHPDRFRWLPMENSYFGDTPEIFSAILASGFVGNKIEEYGQSRGNRFIEFLGRHFPTLTAATIGTYYTLGETILPQLLPGRADSKDVPAVIITTLASPLVANYVRKKWPTWKEKIGEIIKNFEVAK